MGSFIVCDGNKVADFVVEDSAFEGVKDIADTVAQDICLVTDITAKKVSSIKDVDSSTAIVVATLGKSEYIETLAKTGVFDKADLEGKRETYKLQILDGFDGCNKKTLLIVGSDKRGTMYGLFKLSELCGVSPLVYFGDAYPEKKKELEITLDNNKDVFVSKEPSVYYRGFFINDEWPAFGNWSLEQFGGVNAKCYRKVFELLLRLKGNYMWPAMWNSSFSEDGPGLENAILADRYGVVMGTSHHEPLCRAGVEWQNQYKKYGDDNSWSFISNDKAITKFWEDGILRNKDFENVITIGMRGEADSKLLPEDATMKDNIEVVKKAILAQDEILKNHVSGDLKSIPRMLAIYKEVEDYYYGDETCEGLKDWEELKDAIFLLSDDNHGNLRNLPTEEERKHPGGYGMYYHFDYHGAPISYEWTNCNRITKTWEQMSQAYVAGINKIWIVNVGDLKEMEYPLCYFMELAYDYEKWGGKNGLNKTKEFVYRWIDQQFGGRVSGEQKDKLFKVLEGYTKWNSIRTPETMNDTIYAPIHFGESERVLAEVRDILKTADELKNELTGEALLTYESVIYYAAAASMNMVIAWVLTGLNHRLAKDGCIFANSYIDEIEKRVALDEALIKEFNKVADGKWNHCLSSAHTGFRSWDDREWSYPAPVKVLPITSAKALVRFRGSDRYHLGAYWQDMAPLSCDDFSYDPEAAVLLDIDSRGKVAFTYRITLDGSEIACDRTEGKVSPDENFGRAMVRFTFDKDKVAEERDIKGRVDISFEYGQSTYVELLFKTGAPKQYLCIKAEDFKENRKVDGAGFETVYYLGREGSAIKSFPSMNVYNDPEAAPFVSYEFSADEEGEYELDFYLMTRNPSQKGGRLGFYVSANDEEIKTVYSVSDHYYTEWQDPDWAQGVLRAGRIASEKLWLKKGQNELRVYAKDPGVIIEKIVIRKEGFELPESYLGPLPE